MKNGGISVKLSRMIFRNTYNGIPIHEHAKNTRNPAIISSVDKLVFVFANSDKTSSSTLNSKETGGCTFISENII
jgi:hypothetical protein